MAKIYITDQAGEEHILDAPESYTLMEVIRDADLGLPAICGGGCDCATCHILLEPEWREKVGPPGEFELALLEDAPDYDAARSRLSCQISVTPELDGLVAALPDEFH
jgi:2Fe-2S ferredoxin